MARSSWSSGFAFRGSPAWLALFAGLTALPAFGQVSAVRSGSFEVGPFIGASYGIDKFRVMAGGNVTYALKNKYVLPYFEYSFFPGIPRTFSNVIRDNNGVATGTATASISTPIHDIHAGVHVRLPIFKESHIVPYLVFGMGVLSFPDRTGSATFIPSPGAAPLTVPVPFPGSSDFTINGGGGLRYYIGGTGKFGFRAEAKVYKPTTGVFSDQTIGKVEAGFFFQLR
jgi:hypothetical protein